MKVLVAGDWHSDTHETAVKTALETLGHEVERFPWNQYVGTEAGGIGGRITEMAAKAQNWVLAGPLLRRINGDFVSAVLSKRPDVVFVYRGTHITEASLRRIKASRKDVTLVGYSNDDPFSPRQSQMLWRHYRAAIPAYDLVLAYRPHNVEELRRAGAARVALLRSWYVSERNRPVSLTSQDETQFGCEVVFAGHFEDDGRESHLERLLQEGIRVRVFGPDWKNRGNGIVARQGPIVPVRGEDYNRALCAAKIGLCFLSRLNRDTYTRRCFEIPAAGTFLLSEYSDDLAGLFQEGTEAEFFRNEAELVEKVRRYLRDDSARASIAEAGRQRVAKDGHDVVSRMRQVLEWVAESKRAAAAPHAVGLDVTEGGGNRRGGERECSRATEEAPAPRRTF